MTTYEDLRARLDRGTVVILDGATGTELQSGGAPMYGFAWSVPAGSHGVGGRADERFGSRSHPADSLRRCASRAGEVMGPR